MARLEVKSKSSYEQKEWLPPEAMVTEECLVRLEVERLNNLAIAHGAIIFDGSESY